MIGLYMPVWRQETTQPKTHNPKTHTPPVPLCDQETVKVTDLDAIIDDDITERLVEYEEEEE